MVVPMHNAGTTSSEPFGMYYIHLSVVVATRSSTTTSSALGTYHREQRKAYESLLSMISLLCLFIPPQKRPIVEHYNSASCYYWRRKCPPLLPSAWLHGFGERCQPVRTMDKPKLSSITTIIIGDSGSLLLRGLLDHVMSALVCINEV